VLTGPSWNKSAVTTSSGTIWRLRPEIDSVASKGVFTRHSVAISNSSRDANIPTASVMLPELDSVAQAGDKIRFSQMILDYKLWWRLASA
jgi:hypothetical protein